MILNLLAAFFCCLSEKRKGRLLFWVLPLTLFTSVCAIIWKYPLAGDGVYHVTGEELTDHALLYQALILSIPGSALVGYALTILYRHFKGLTGLWPKIGAIVLLLLMFVLGIGGIEVCWIVIFTILAFLLDKKEFSKLEEKGGKADEKLRAVFAAIEQAYENLTQKLRGIFEEEESDSEDDFMNSKRGKFVMVVCVLMVIYMIASGFAIYKLNAKINSVYEITQEMK